MKPWKGWLVVLGAGLLFWGYRSVQTYMAYEVAMEHLGKDAAIETALGKYRVSFDWWLMAVRSPWEGDIRRFDFHLDGVKDDAVGSVELHWDRGWQIRCFKVVNGQYANKLVAGGACLGS